MRIILALDYTLLPPRQAENLERLQRDIRAGVRGYVLHPRAIESTINRSAASM